MPRVAFRLWLKPEPELIETYVRYHLDPFPELYDLIRAAGIRNYTIWLDETDLLLTREGETPTVGEKLRPEDPVHKDWIDHMTPCFQPRVRESGATMPEEVFAFQPDGAHGPAQMTYRVRLVPGQAALDGLREIHAKLPSELIDAMHAAGVRRQWTWVEDGDAWFYRESDDTEAARASLFANPAYRAYRASMQQWIDPASFAAGPRPTREVFRCD